MRKAMSPLTKAMEEEAVKSGGLGDPDPQAEEGEG
jgi:hypothetical protein